MASTPPVILADTKNLRLRQSMLLGSRLEGGWNSPYPIGDNGTSFGPFQMHIGGALTAAGGTPAQADNPKWAVPAMMPAYSKAVNQISDHLWTTDPERAAEQAAVIAERPAEDYYTSRGTGTVNTAWSSVANELHKRKSTGGMPPQDATLTSSGDATGLTQAIGPLLKILSSLLGGSGGFDLGGIKGDFERIGLIIFGGALILLGILVFALPAAERAVGVAAKTTRQGKTLAAIGGSGDSGEDPADVQRRQEIASRSLALGEQKVQLARQRENRLAGKQDFS